MYRVQTPLSDSRKNIAYLTIVIAIGILLWSFYDLQVKSYESYLERSERNRVRQVVVEPPRGLIYDRNGILLVENRPSYAVSVIPWEANRSPRVYELLSGYLGYDKEYLLSRVKKNSIGQFQPAKVKRSINLITLSILEEHSIELPGVVYGLFPERFYPTKAGMSHMLGYIREISDADLERFKTRGYKKGDLIGSIGLERSYEEILRGEKGYEYIQVDALGRRISKIETAESKSPIPGNDLHLTIDLGMQLEAENIMRDRRGAIIFLDPSNGDIISFVSAPSYSLATFAGAITPEVWNALQNDESDPLFNRATMSKYPPGSTFKLIAAAAAIDNGIIDRNWTVNCPGYYKLGRRIFKCNKFSGHGKISVVEAIGQSCNVFFYNLMFEIGLEKWYEQSKIFQFDSKTHIDITEENSGMIPNKLLLDNKYGEGKWQEGHLLNLVLGQGDLLVTPIQMVNLMSIIRNEGKYYNPHFAKKYYSANQEIRSFFDIEYHEKAISADISSETWKILKEGMNYVMQGESGTGRFSNLPELDIYAKTGTAQNPHGDDHAWFVGFVEDDQNPLAFAIIVENGGSGGATAAPIGKKLIKKYYDSFASNFALESHTEE